MKANADRRTWTQAGRGGCKLCVAMMPSMEAEQCAGRMLPARGGWPPTRPFLSAQKFYLSPTRTDRIETLSPLGAAGIINRRHGLGRARAGLERVKQDRLPEITRRPRGATLSRAVRGRPLRRRHSVRLGARLPNPHARPLQRSRASSPYKLPRCPLLGGTLLALPPRPLL
jgi:hypothetical protein